jgi:hypothetical protein
MNSCALTRQTSRGARTPAALLYSECASDLELFLGPQKLSSAEELARHLAKSAMKTGIAGTAGILLTSYLETKSTTSVSPEYRRYFESQGLGGLSEKEMIDRLPHVVMIGDSLSKDFHMDSDIDTIWQMWSSNQSDCFIDTSDERKSVFSFFERVSAHTPIVATEYSRPGAEVFDEYEGRSKFVRAIAGKIWSLSEQVEHVLSEKRFPDLTLLWIGHNNMDWVHGLTNEERQHPQDRLDWIRQSFISSYDSALNRLIQAAQRKPTKSAIVVFGMINMEGYSKLRTYAEDVNSRNPKAFPYLKKSIEYFESLKPEYRAHMIELEKQTNADLKTLVLKLQGTVDPAQIKLYYSDEMETLNLDRLMYLNPLDAWHPSVIGRTLFAEHLFQGAQEALDFLGLDMKH